VLSKQGDIVDLERLWEQSCRQFERNGDLLWPRPESSALCDALIACTEDVQLGMLAGAARAWALAMPGSRVLAGRLACLRQVVASNEAVGPKARPGLVQWLLDRVEAAAAETALAQLEEAARADPLIGAEDWRALQDTASAALARAEHDGTDLTVAVVVLDELQAPSDSEGHAAGGAAPFRLVATFRGSLRSGDRIFRVAGDELALIMPSRVSARAIDIPSVMARVAAVGAPPFSWGAAFFPADGSTLAELLDVADMRLHEGRHRARAVSTSAPWPDRPTAAAVAGMRSSSGLPSEPVPPAQPETRSRIRRVTRPKWLSG
jgi:diguanylate cyclase (GGDEF)-like protein